MTVTTRNGYTFQIDPEDWEKWKHLSWYGWHSDKSNHTPYIVASLSASQTNRYLHRAILSAPRGVSVDHINGDGLDNRRSNLRLCSVRENSQNRKTRPRKRPYKGVEPVGPGGNVFKARICVNGRRKYLGNFSTAEAAARAYDAAAIKYFGEFARPNFPAESNPHAA